MTMTEKIKTILHLVIELETMIEIEIMTEIVIEGAVVILQNEDILVRGVKEIEDPILMINSNIILSFSLPLILFVLYKRERNRDYMAIFYYKVLN